MQDSESKSLLVIKALQVEVRRSPHQSFVRCLRVIPAKRAHETFTLVRDTCLIDNERLNSNARSSDLCSIDPSARGSYVGYEILCARMIGWATSRVNKINGSVFDR